MSAIKQSGRLAEHGVDDADADWGKYLLLRPWDEARFLKSLAAAERVPVANLNRDGNRAVMFCSTTDAYQVITHSNSARARELNDQRAHIVRRALELIRDRSTLNVRILTRGPLAKLDFELFRSFGNRLMFGMSIPSLDNNLVRLFEPNAPAPARRLEVLREAAKAGIPTFVAIAPAYPDCGAHDLRQTLAAVKEAGVKTVFFESINIRAENVERIRQHAADLGQDVNLDAFNSQTTWRKYSLEQLALVQQIATDLGMVDRLHLWPDKGLLTEKHYVALIKEEFSRLNTGLRLTPEQSRWLNQLAKAKFVEVKGWIDRWHQRISEWPGTNNPGDWTAPAIPAGICAPPAPVDLVVQQPSPSPKPESNHTMTLAPANDLTTGTRAEAEVRATAPSLLPRLSSGSMSGTAQTCASINPARVVGRPYTTKMRGTIVARRNLKPMKTIKYPVSENQQLSLNLQGHDTSHSTPPVTAALTEFNGNGNGVRPSRLPLILKSPLAQIPMEEALEYMAQVDGDGPPAAVDPDAACAFKRSLVRRRVMTVQWKGASFLTVSDVDVLWSPKSETGMVLDLDPTDGIYIASEIRALTSEEIGKAMLAIYLTTGGPALSEGGPPMTVDRNLLPEEALTSLFVDEFEGSREEARQACKVELDKCVRWVDHIDLN